ncbi:MAG: ABC transporter substrate-binding protein [Desulfurococcales archaeon]|nr:ABC transporter substrate-binding protein [Desulfurococcales archaeon]MCE4629152.1 ABC transporter substrate-binding protein [Desulfurococcales archaeon]
MRVFRISAFALIALLLVPIAASAVSTAQNQNWPWGNASEPFPWLDYLKSLPHEDGVTLIIITRHESTILEKTRQAFLSSPVAKELGIKNIQFVQAGPEQWETYIQRGIERGRPIDVAWGGGPTLFNYIDSKGYLEPLDTSTHPEYLAVMYEMTKIPETIAGVPTYLKGDDGFIHWIGAAISSFGITVNHKLLQQYNLPTPQKWDDLTKPEFAKELPTTPLVGVADPTMSTSNTRMYEIILQGYGWDQGWRVLTLMAANAKIYDSSSGVRDAVILGEIAAGITIDFYGYTAMHQNPDCEYILPQGLTIVNADPIAIIKGTKHPVQAAAFVAWVLSQYGGQQIWLDTDVNRLPINPSVFNTTLGQERQDLLQAYETAINSPGIQFNETLAGLTERPMQFYFKATLVKAHDDLQQVWAAIAKAYLEGKITKEQFDTLVNKLTEPFTFKDPLTNQEVTFTEEYAIKISKHIGDQAVFQALMSQWEDGARQRYQETYQLLQQMLQGGTATGTQTGTTTQETTTTTTGGGGISTQLIAVIIGIIVIIGAAYFILKK